MLYFDKIHTLKSINLSNQQSRFHYDAKSIQRLYFVKYTPLKKQRGRQLYTQVIFG